MVQIVSMQQVYDELKRIESTMATKKDIEALGDTIEILSNSQTIVRIKESENDVDAGRVKKITNVQDMLQEIEQ